VGSVGPSVPHARGLCGQERVRPRPAG
jgi:hypothetical protein